jgi:hypothetical protein
MNKTVWVVVFALSFMIGCSPKLLIKKELSSNEIAICLNSGDKIPEILRHDIDSTTNKFIEEYNISSNKYKLISCQNDSMRTLFLNVLTIQVTNPGQQAAGVLVTAIGTITPFIMIAAESPVYIWFGYLPRSAIRMNMKLSKDISANTSKQPRNSWAGSNKYFGSYETQKKLLLTNYYNKLNYEIRQLELNTK